MNIIEIKNLSKTFHGKSGEQLKVLDSINIEIQQNDFFMLLGPSGSGKSTLLRIMCGLDEPTAGVISYDDSIQKSDFGFVFQEFGLLPWLTVAQNIELPLLNREKSPHKRVQRVHTELERLSLSHFSQSYPHELSGGMKQRVGIARALIIQPKVIFLDEPFSELDSFTADELRKELLNIWHETGCTIVMVTHLVTEAISLGNRIAVLTPRPGKIEAIVENSLPRPRQKRSQNFFDFEDKIYELIKP